MSALPPRPESTRSLHRAAGIPADPAWHSQPEFKVPLIMLGIGFVLAVGIPAIKAIVSGDGLGPAISLTVVYALMVVASAVIAVPAILLTCRLLATNAGPLDLVVVRLLGIFAIVGAVEALTSGAGGFLLSLVITGALFALLFQMDIREGMFVAAATWAAHVVIKLAFFAATI